MYYKEIIFAALVAVTVTACATVPEAGTGPTELERLVAEQQEQINAANSRIDELNIKVMLLQQKLGSRGANTSEGTVPDNLPDRPPAGLSVVELTDAAAPVVILKSSSEKSEPARVLSLKGSKKSSGSVEKKSKKKDKAAKLISPKGLYSIGHNLFLEGRHDDARDAFGLFIKIYPKHSLTDNALYWMGESYYTQKRYDRAIKSFLKIADFYPKGNKAPDALLRLGYTYIEKNDYVRASRAFKRLVASYPGSVAAGKADKMLKTLLSQQKEGPK